jgi:DNA-binding CsgD family transcriptional regulator
MPVEHLPQHDLAVLLDVLHALYAAPTVADYQRELLTGLRRLVPADFASFAETDARKRPRAIRTDPGDVVQLPDAGTILQRHLHESPLFSAYTRGQGSAVMMSDFLTRRQWDRLAIYSEFFRPIGSAFYIAKGLPGPRGAITALGLHRTRRDFSEGHRALLNLLGPHFNQAYGNAALVGRLREELETLRRGVEDLGQALLLLDGHRVSMTTPRATRLIGAYAGPIRRGCLPDAIRSWLVREDRARAVADTLPQPLLLERSGRRLIVRLVSRPGQRVLLLEEEQDQPLEPRTLEVLGLSRRESEVLVWVAEGKTNAEIAVILGTSPRTVDKHVEHVLRKLGVETRTAAVARALAVGGRAA